MTEAQKVPRRDEVPVKDTWDLTKIYANTAAWEQDVARIEGLLPEVAALQGMIREGADKLLQALTLRDEIFNILYSLYVYASHRKDSDSTDPSGQALDERADGSRTRQRVGIDVQHVLTGRRRDAEVDVRCERERTRILEHPYSVGSAFRRAGQVRDHDDLVGLLEEGGDRARELDAVSVRDDDGADLHVPSISR